MIVLQHDAEAPVWPDICRFVSAKARRGGLSGALIFSGGGGLCGVEGAPAAVARFQDVITEAPHVLTSLLWRKASTERRLFSTPGLVSPLLRPAETAWLETAMQRQPCDGARLLAFLSWTALRQAEADSGVVGSVAALAETWSPFEEKAEGDADPTPEIDLLSPTYS